MLTYPDFEQKQILFVLLSYGEKISFKNDNIIITDKDDKIKHQSTCYKLFMLFVVGHITITSGILQRAQKFGFTIVLLSHYFKFIGLWSSKTEGNVLLRRKQYEYTGLDIAKHIVINKIQNQISALLSVRKRGEEINFAAGFLKKQLEELQKTENAALQSLLGFEGVCSRIYFKGLYSNIQWTGRKPRVKADSANALLDIGYTILFNIIDAILNSYGFDVYQGVYHTNFYQRKSLTCDLVEPFRPVIDMQIRKAYNLQMVKKEDFSIIEKQYRLFGKKAEPYILYLLEGILKYKKPLFLYLQSYYRAFIKDKTIEDYPVFNLGD